MVIWINFEPYLPTIGTYLTNNTNIKYTIPLS